MVITGLLSCERCNQCVSMTKLAKFLRQWFSTGVLRYTGRKCTLIMVTVVHVYSIIIKYTIYYTITIKYIIYKLLNNTLFKYVGIYI